MSTFQGYGLASLECGARRPLMVGVGGHSGYGSSAFQIRALQVGAGNTKEAGFEDFIV